MLKELIDVAFNNNVKKLVKKSYNKTIDVQFGLYEGGKFDGWLTINLKPSKGWLDWLINLVAGAQKTTHGRVHRGYWCEIVKYWADFKGAITNDKDLVAGSCKGIIIAGRSKGAAEAVIIATKLWSAMYHNRIIVGAIDPPMMCDKEFARFAERLLGKENIHWTCYKNDIVPGIPSWFTFPGMKHQIGKRTLGLSTKDHVTATTKEKVIYEGLGYVG